MPALRRDFVKQSLAAAAVATLHSPLRGATASGIPGPYPGRVVEVRHPGCILQGAYQAPAVQQMMRRGMRELTGAPDWQSAWRTLFQPGDVVGIKVSPVGGKLLSSDATVLHEIFAGLQEAKVPAKSIVVFSRYRREVVDAGMDQWLVPGVRWTGASEQYDDIQLDMDGYDPDHYMDMALVQPGQNINDAHMRRSYVAKVVTQQITKLINLPTLKHHQSAGVTIALKNMSHGMVNNVCRSHTSPTLNACGAFIPAVVNLPVIRQKAVLHILDAVKASYHGGPGAKPKYIWEHKAMYFATDPVALDKTGWQVIDAKRAEVGMAPIATSKPDKDSTFLNCQVEHIEIAGALGLGVFDDKKIDVRRIALT